jgi:hypothetical protein
MMQAELLASVLERVTKLPNAANGIRQEVILAAVCSQTLKELPHFGNHRHATNPPILRSGFRVASDDDLAASRIAVTTEDSGCFIQTRAAVGEKLDGIRAVLAETLRGVRTWLTSAMNCFGSGSRSSFCLTRARRTSFARAGYRNERPPQPRRRARGEESKACRS